MSTNEDTLRSLGKLLEAGQGERDAVHIAVAPVVANEELKPGQAVGFIDGSAERVGPSDRPIGIVDPFLPVLWVQPGQRFWLYLTPGSITSLRHDWTHPAFPARPEEAPSKDSAEVAASKLWLREAAEAEGLSYQRVLDTAVDGTNLTIQGQDCHLSVDGEFWRHVEVITGRRFDEEHRENVYFGCSC